MTVYMIEGLYALPPLKHCKLVQTWCLNFAVDCLQKGEWGLPCAMCECACPSVNLLTAESFLRSVSTHI